MLKIWVQIWVLWFNSGRVQKHVPTVQWIYGEEKQQVQNNMSSFVFNIPPKPVLSFICQGHFVKQDIFLEIKWKTGNNWNILRKEKSIFIFIFSTFACWNRKDNDWVELYGRQLCTASLSKKSHLQFCITQMSLSFHLYLNLKIYSILFTLQESYTNDPFLNTCKVFLHLDTKYLIIYV